MKRSVVYPVRGRSSRVLAALVVGSAVFVLAASTSTAATKVRKPAKKVAATTTSKAPSVSSTAAPKVVVTTTAEPSGVILRGVLIRLGRAVELLMRSLSNCCMTN